MWYAFDNYICEHLMLICSWTPKLIIVVHMLMYSKIFVSYYACHFASCKTICILLICSSLNMYIAVSCHFGMHFMIRISCQSRESRSSSFLMVNFRCLRFPFQHDILFSRWVAKHFMLLDGLWLEVMEWTMFVSLLTHPWVKCSIAMQLLVIDCL